jgi:hypothetical protein
MQKKHAYFFVTSIFFSSLAHCVNSIPKDFTVYAYIAWNNPIEDLSSYGIEPIEVLYENRLRTDGRIDREKIQKLAEEAALTPVRPLSFDLEFGNRFEPETLMPQVQAILHTFRRFNRQNPIGLYALLPQNTYGKQSQSFSYEHLNSTYSRLKDLVDFVSPSLYNYEGRDLEAWIKTARYSLGMAKKYAPSKPILPYISPVYRLGPAAGVKNGHVIVELGEEEMRQRITALYELGASGCIIWTSSQDRNEKGEKPRFSPNRGWGKAVVQFIKSHHRLTR